MQGITFRTSDKSPSSFNGYGLGRATDPHDLLARTWQSSTREETSLIETRYMRCKELIQSSIPKDPDGLRNFIPRSNGFVDTVLMAYNQHYNLILRPDDIWMAILSQLNFYVNANAENLRKFFVQHEGKRELELEYAGSRQTFDFSIMAKDFAVLLKENINDPSLYDFILPNFSTTGPNDTVICSIMMMSILKSYFSFTCSLTCGIPEVTLLGSKADYLNILNRIDKLGQMGMGGECSAFASLLKPVVKQFVAAFDAVAACPEDPKVDQEFWGRICHERRQSSGDPLLSGWITVFCVWNSKGRWYGPNLETLKYHYPSKERFLADGMEYPIISIPNIPSGWCEAEVKLNDNGEKLDCLVIAGHLATEVMKNPGSGAMDTLSPAPQWFMLAKEEVVERRKIEPWMKPYLPKDLADSEEEATIP